MDKDWQDTLFKTWTDSDVALRRPGSNHTQSDHSPSKTPNHSPKSKGNESLTAEDSKEDERRDSEAGTFTEPPSPQPRTPLKRRPASTRPSVDMFRSPGTDDSNNSNSNSNNDDGKSKQSRASVGDDGSVYTVDSTDDERRLSDRVKKAWRGVTGQKLADPLEQWMVKHSGGTLRDAPPVNRPPKEPSDRQ
ncbi:hypothetical protein F4859DRAFT_508362 [Xylaria cf. heliscus]|nr:hypothetical protein F4859DRAFT_508362 [Xylaria cf. heliscus]